MEWYWWVLIVVGAAVIGWAKLTVLKKWTERRRAKNEPPEDDE